MVTNKRTSIALLRANNKIKEFAVGRSTVSGTYFVKRATHGSVVRGGDGAWKIVSGRGNRLMALYSTLLDPLPEEAEEIAQSGIPADFVVLLAGLLSRSAVELALQIGISRTTLDRKVKAHDHLDFVGSDRTMRYARLLKLALDVWETEQAAREWLNTSNPFLGGVTPFDRAATDAGFRQIEDLLGQIAHGILP